MLLPDAVKHRLYVWSYCVAMIWPSRNCLYVPVGSREVSEKLLFLQLGVTIGSFQFSKSKIRITFQANMGLFDTPNRLLVFVTVFLERPLNWI